jgi:flagellar protein FlaG
VYVKERTVMIERISFQSSTHMYESKRVLQAERAETVGDETVKKNDMVKVEEEIIPKEKLEEIVKGMNEFLQPSHTSLKFELHDELKEYYVQIIDERTNEIIREIPPKKLLDIYAAMMEFVGLIVDKKI